MVAGVNLSDHCESFTFTESTQELRHDAHGDNFQYNTPGLKQHSLSARFYNDFASGSVYATLKALYATNPPALHNVVVKQDSGANSATNPAYSGSYFIQSMSPVLGGRHGDNTMIDVTWSPAGAVTELTA